MKRLSVLFLMVAAGGACNSDRDGGTTPDGGISASGCQECGPFEDVLKGLCSAIDRCPNFIYPLGYRSAGECVSILAWATTCFVDDEANDRDEGLPETFKRQIPRLSQGDATSCANWIKAASCDDVNRLMRGDAKLMSPCTVVNSLGNNLSDDNEDSSNAPMTPSRPALGEACTSGTECADGLFCRTATQVIPGTHAESCATCTRKPAMGEPCRPFYEPCATGLRCVQPQGFSYEIYGTCGDLAAAGERCGSKAECGSGFCWEEGLAETWTCREGGGEGQPCNPRGACRDGFVCLNATRTCTIAKKSGEACTENRECGGLDCGSDGRCGIPTGGTCRNDIYCREGFCDSTTNKCALPKALGERCQNDTHCVSKHCASGSRTCTTPRCYGNEECAANQYCHWQFNTCTDKRTTGMACDDDDECVSNYCTSNDTCGAPAALGDSCVSSSQCYPAGACDGGKCVALKNPGQSCSSVDSCKPPFICQGNRCELINISCLPAKVGQPCASLRVCEANATCDFVNNFTCRERGGLGTACLRTIDCQASFYCGRVATGRQCLARPTQGPCDSDMPCAPGYNCIYDVTTSDSVCKKGPVGDACDAKTPCPAGHVCGRENRCRLPLVVGDPCSSSGDNECPAPLYCKDGTCANGAELGADCHNGIRCGAGLHCNQSAFTCTTNLPPDALCPHVSSQCIDGYACIADDATMQNSPRHCRAQKSLGGSCRVHDECLSGACGGSRTCVEPMCVPPP